MTQQYVVVNHPADFRFNLPGVEVISARKYLSDLSFARIKKARIYNLCRSYRYQKAGYYVSLLAAARNHKSLPDITTIQDTRSSNIIRLRSSEFEKVMKRSMENVEGDEKSLDFYFGHCDDPAFDDLGKQVYQHFQAPLLRLNMVKAEGAWIVRNLHLLSSGELEDEQVMKLESHARTYFHQQGKRFSRNTGGYQLAILHNPEEKEPPSNPGALQKFIEVAASRGMTAQLITPADYGILHEFDALFIRETTNVNHHTYRFARRAQVEGLVVIDDPESIMKCSNKVYLAELLRVNGIPMPETFVITRENAEDLSLHLDFPVILKQPDSAFSQGVIKVKDPEEYREKVKGMLQSSDMVVAQAFVPTDYDWRIGVLDGKPLYACKYYMAKGHWQIYDWKSQEEDPSGDAETLRIEEVPHPVMAAALSATRLIGKGLYGVDLKEINGYPYVIEVNDNPNLDAGIEDAVLGDKLYARLTDVFIQRINRIRSKAVSA